ncbi:hypothetical protein [Effusibacillus consociatus]|uniref:DUF5050 domain-containing protein n=1 Tax=Effusibacillus consociatus TaxID=1117041 RepID=A0ABV9PX17_9BACL
MDKRLCIIPLLLVMLLLNLVGCSQEANKSKKFSGSLAYASYHKGDYTLYFVDPNTLEKKEQFSLTKGYGDEIFKDSKERIWIPVQWKPDSTTRDNSVVVFDLTNSKKTIIQVGFIPLAVFFKDHDAYIVCRENGFNPTIYKVDSSLQATKWKTIENSGLISGLQFDGNNIYWNSLLVDPKDPKQSLPQLVRVSLSDGLTQVKKLSNEQRGFHGLLYFNGHLYMGLQGEEGNLLEFDPKTLQQTRIFPYKDMVGELKVIGDQKIAVTNYSARYKKGAKISVFDINKAEVISSFDSQNAAEHLSYINGKFYIVDNRKNKIEIWDATGKSNQVFEAPTMVSNILLVN